MFSPLQIISQGRGYTFHSIPYQIESRIELHSLGHDLAENTNEESVHTNDSVGEEEEEEDDIEGTYFAEPQDCTTTICLPTICLTHQHKSLSAGVYAEKRKVMLTDLTPDERYRKKQK